MTWRLLLPFVAVLGASAAVPNPFGASRWRAKPVVLEHLPERATFPVLLLQRLSNRFQLDRAEIVWVSPTAPFPNVPGR